MNRITLSDGTYYPSIFDICHCGKCNEVIYGGKEYKNGHNYHPKKIVILSFQELEIKRKRKERIRKKELLKITKFQPIFDICWCGECNEIVYNGKRYIHGHNERGVLKSKEERQKSSIANTKLFLLKPDGSKEIYPPIFDICHCSNHCNTIVWGGKQFAVKHGRIGRKATPETIKKIRDSHIGQPSGNKGNTYSKETKSKMSKAIRRGYINGTRKAWCKGLRLTESHIENLRISHKGQIPSPKSGSNYCRHYYHFSPLQGVVCFRSSYEYKYALYLEYNHESYMYEEIIFDLGRTTYILDFYLPISKRFIDTKGYLYPKSKSKIERFRDKYSHNLEILYKDDLQKLGINMKIKIPEISYEEAISNKDLTRINTEKVIIKGEI